jgi:myo-inositol 2-dehydrogenase / D-chiro-inositol 1-dehydrogenase
MIQKSEVRRAARPSRRDFLRKSVASGVAAYSAVSLVRSVHAAGDDVLKIGLIGCGGRGSGAALNALGADKNCKLVAMADAFGDRLESSLRFIKKAGGDKVAVDADHCFVGLDAGDKLIQSGVDVVLLCEPPHFRPAHLKSAIAAGKHVFCEKPVAVDAPGVRSVLASAAEARKKGLSLVSGLCWRHNSGVRETMQRVLDGAIGDVVSIQETYLTGHTSHRPRQPDWTEMLYQLRNWYYFTWLSGDFNVEQHVHSIDKAAWAMHDQPPLRAWGMGGRQVRVDPKFGTIFDHHAVVYECANGTRVHSYCRQMPGCFADVSDIIVGAKGKANVLKNKIEGEKTWHYSGPQPNMYDVEHQELFASIRAGKPINDGERVANSTMWTILGRMVDYTGQELTWEQAINSQETLAPAKYAFDAEPPVKPDADGRYPIAVPGVTQFR